MSLPVSACGGGENQWVRTLAALKGIADEEPKYKARKETVWPLVKPEASVTPSKLVGAVCGTMAWFNCTFCCVVIPKKGARLFAKKTFGGEVEETAPVTREKRRPTKSEVTEAGVLPLAAVKEAT